MWIKAPELAMRLSRYAEAVCRYYLSNGRRAGRYWIVGDARNSRGRSMFVRLIGPQYGKGAAGKWQDAATGEHGDLLDVIREACGLVRFSDVADEARRFLSVPSLAAPAVAGTPMFAAKDSRVAARRLFAMSKPISGTLAEIYLRNRSITNLNNTRWLRFHPRCYWSSGSHGTRQSLPAIIAASTDLSGEITGVLRTWLARDGSDKALIDTPRRAMGDILGHAVRFGEVDDVMAAGEGIETVMSVNDALPEMPHAAATTAAHLAALIFPPALRRLYILQDPDPAGQKASKRLTKRAVSAGIEPIVLLPRGEDFNHDLRHVGKDGLLDALRAQLHRDDIVRFMAA